jgi:hypothetical protein
LLAIASEIYSGVVAQDEMVLRGQNWFELAGESRVWLKIRCDWFNILTDSLDVFNGGI